ncbi:His/Gly/Thr/Pro-type tRNA ligase C-terminal domain-containing protein [Patescibacteria group bacterium]|nr:His/Gly/Thr/Pro-type tRNA ligase C-terminal domain-containing protein [Patescibacteria group bacterium]
MRYSNLFGKTLRDFPKDEVSVNAKYLLRAGFIDKLMAGSFTLLPLGFRVVEKIKQIIRDEMDATGANEMLMPLLHPKEIWNETGRWETAKGIMFQLKKDNKEYGLSFTHEEIVMDLIRKRTQSFKDFPIKIYHFSTKFRDEPRAKSGILRGREFIMKDLYSAHTSKEDMEKYYWEVAKAYIKTFKRMGLNAKIVEAAGGVFTDAHTHEFQVLCEQGEDTIYYCDSCDFAQNKEIFEGKGGKPCPKCKKGKIIEAKAIEVGNIFPLGTMYSEKMHFHFTDRNGSKKPVVLASYGIGPTRLLGTLVEVFHDDKGIIWPKSVAPYGAHLISINSNEKADSVYRALEKEGIEVLYDDRETGAGEKFADADLIGIPVRLVVSPKTENRIEYKERGSEKIELLPLEDVLKKLK